MSFDKILLKFDTILLQFQTILLKFDTILFKYWVKQCPQDMEHCYYLLGEELLLKNGQSDAN